MSAVNVRPCVKCGRVLPDAEYRYGAKRRRICHDCNRMRMRVYYYAWRGKPRPVRVRRIDPAAPRMPAIIANAGHLSAEIRQAAALCGLRPADWVKRAICRELAGLHVEDSCVPSSLA